MLIKRFHFYNYGGLRKLTIYNYGGLTIYILISTSPALAASVCRNLPFTWFFNKWKQIEIIKIHAESHEHKQSFIKWIGFKNFLWQIEVLLTQVKFSVCWTFQLWKDWKHFYVIIWVRNRCHHLMHTEKNILNSALQCTQLFTNI